MNLLGLERTSIRPVGVAFSGGADSTALLLALHRCGYPVVGLHCNFHLRGEESDRDAEFCRALCDIEQIDFYSVDFDTAALRQGGESVEMCCRRLRYDWFETMAVELGLSAVALAHHREDSVETLFINLFRGTGLRGLCGIRRRRGRYIRPFLDMSRGEIEAFLGRCGIRFMTDSTNSLNDFRRNRLRNQLLPAIDAAFPEALVGVSKTATDVSASLGLLDGLVGFVAKNFFDGCAIDLRRLAEVPVDSVQLLYHAAAIYFPPGINLSTANDVIASRLMSGLTFPLLDGSCLNLDYGLLCRAEKTEYCEIDVSLTDLSTWPYDVDIQSIGPEQFCNMIKTPYDLFLDASVLERNHRLVLRPWRIGDRIQPYGMTGSRLVSDIFSDAKVPANIRRRPVILTCDGIILWVIGLRASRHFPVTGNTKSLLHVRVRIDSE